MPFPLFYTSGFESGSTDQNESGSTSLHKIIHVHYMLSSFHIEHSQHTYTQYDGPNLCHVIGSFPSWFCIMFRGITCAVHSLPPPPGQFCTIYAPVIIFAYIKRTRKKIYAKTWKVSLLPSHICLMYVQELEVLTHLYGKLLYKMGEDFLDIQYTPIQHICKLQGCGSGWVLTGFVLW